MSYLLNWKHVLVLSKFINIKALTSQRNKHINHITPHPTLMFRSALIEKNRTKNLLKKKKRLISPRFHMWDDETPCIPPASDRIREGRAGVKGAWWLPCACGLGVFVYTSLSWHRRDMQHDHRLLSTGHCSGNKAGVRMVRVEARSSFSSLTRTCWFWTFCTWYKVNIFCLHWRSACLMSIE